MTRLVSDATNEHTMRLGAYVGLPLDDVIERFGRPDMDEVLTHTWAAALDGRSDRMDLRTSAPERLAANDARVKVRWELADQAGRTSEGSASIQLLVVQSGREPLTEVLATLTVGEDVARPVAGAVRRFLDLLTDRLASEADAQPPTPRSAKSIG